jgi:hypothetical protein
LRKNPVSGCSVPAVNDECEEPKPMHADWRVRGAAAVGVVVGFLIGLVIFGAPWHLPPAWGDIPTWITAIATIGLLIGAIVTARYAIKAFQAQSDQLAEQRELNKEQTTVLRLQANELRASLDQRKREEAEQRRAQASRVFIETVTGPDFRIPQTQRAIDGLTHELATARITNSSQQPIYDVTIGWRKGTAPWGEPDRVPVVMPTAVADFDRALPTDLPSGVDRSLFSAVVRFRDTSGVRWLLRPDGQFDEDPAPS